jgi:glycosyltransferase involved in cell wall biosynthesis
MIRLLTIQPVAERGGSDQALARMLRSLPAVEFECHVVVPAEPPLREEFEASGAAVHVVPMERISTSHRLDTWARYGAEWPVVVTRLARLIRSLDIDVVHTNSLHSWYGWAAAAVTRRPHVWHAREITVQSAAALRVEQILTRHFATRVIAMSQAIADQLPGADVVVVHETVDGDEFSAAHAGHFRRTVDIPDDVPLVGAAGRIDTWKGFDVLLDAFPLVTERVPDAHLVVAGGAVEGKETYAEALHVLAATMPQTRWLGPRTDVPEIFADLDLFVLPSTEPEPYGLVAVEALASGVPVVMTDAGGPREIAAHAAPGAARLVDVGDAEALADGIVASLEKHGRSTTASRRARLPLRDPEPPDRFAAELRRAAATRAPGPPVPRPDRDAAGAG